MKEVLVQLLGGKAPTLVIHGGAEGIDTLADKWAKKHGYKVEVYKPEWRKYGTRAALERNTTMAQKADFFVAFPTKESRGTRHAIGEIRKRLPASKIKIIEK